MLIQYCVYGSVRAFYIVGSTLSEDARNAVQYPSNGKIRPNLHYISNLAGAHSFIN